MAKFFKTAIFLDDVRDYPEILTYLANSIIVVRDVSTAEIYIKAALENLNEDERIIVCLDHDLGENQKTGYDLAKWMVEFVNPSQCYFSVHSMNVVGKENISQLLLNYEFAQIIL